MKKNVLFKTALLLVVMLFSFWGNVSAQTWQMVDLSELTATDVFVIVDITSGCAMPNNKGTSSAPNAVSVTVNGDHLEGDIDGSLKWNISGNGTDGYIFYPNGTTEKWLYCSVNAGTTSGSNNNMRVGTGENKTFILHNNNWLAHVYSSNHTRYVGVYNSSEGPQDWRGYNNTSSNVANTQTRFFKYTEAVSTVATPVISPASGTYYTSQTVEITCETAGATIFYTTDGSRPDGNSSVYETPITVSTTTTLKAIAVLGTDTSNVATANYTLPVEVENIAELRQQFTNSTMYRIMGEVVVTFAGLDSNNNDRYYTYIQDETGGMLIYEQTGNITASLTKGDVISGFLGTATTYHGMLEMTPIQLGESVGHDESRVDTLELALSEVSSDYQAQLVKVMNVTFATEGTFNALAGNKVKYFLVGSDDVVAQIRYRDNPLSGTEIPTAPQNLIALVYQYDSEIDLSLLSLEEFVPEPTECENVPSMGACIAELDGRDMLFTGQVAVDDTLCTLNRYGFVYSTSNTEPELDGIDCETVVLGTTIEAGTPFTHRIAELGYDTYYVRAFASNEVGTGYSTVASVQQAEPEIYAVDFRLNSHEGWTSVASYSVIEGESIEKFPMMEDCGNLTFAGWALQPFEGTTTEFPALFNTFTPTSDTTFYAVFSNIQNAMNDEIVISRASFENVEGYGTDDQWTAVSKVAGTVITGWCDLYTAPEYMQMRVNPPYGSHPYNETALPGAITSITMYSNEKDLGSTPTREWTPWISSSSLTKENYERDGISLGSYNLPASSSYTWNVDGSIKASYFYLALTRASSYIDSIVIAYTSGEALYTMSAVDTVTIDQTICEGMTYEDEHFTTGIEGTHDALVINSDYCATQYILNLSLEARDTLRHYVDTCDTYTLNGQPYTNSEQVFVVTPAEDPYGCPVVDEWNITIRHSSEGDTAAIACNSYSWHDYTDLTESGDYTATLVNAEGCDSIVTLHLTINLSDTAHLYESICENDLPYHYENGEIDATFEIGTPALTTATYNLNTVNGCDSIVFLHLTVNPVPEHHETVENCGPYRWNDSTYAVSGDYEKVFRLATGCDSTAYLHLTINHGDYAEVMVDTCGTEYYWEFADTTITQSGTYYHYSPNANTCTDTTALILSLHQAVTTEISAQICEGDTYNQNGFNVGTEGDHELNLQTIYGCDSTVILHLAVGNAAITYLTPSICEGDSYNENGFEFDAPEVGVIEDSIVIVRPGTCDSIVKLTLTVNALPTVTISGETAFCEGSTTTLTASGAMTYEWSATDHNAELTVGQAGEYTVIGTDANGCKNTATQAVAIKPVSYGDTTAVACGSFDWHSYIGLTESGDYTDVLTNAAGCDSTVTLHLTINVPTEGDTTAVACGSFDWHSYNGLTESGDYTDVMTNAAGCDSTVTLHLTINVPTEGDTTAVACGSFDWHSYTGLTESGDYTDVMTNAAGCDSTVTLHLTVNQPTEGDTTAVACGSFDWHSYNGLTESGDYTDVLTNAAGCDSTVTLHLTINQPTEGDTTAVACGSFDWHSYNGLTESGEYTDVLTNAAGCDSTVTLHLTINPLPTVTISGEAFFCEGSSTTLTASGAETYTWGDETTAELTVAEAGTYSVTGTDANGCTATASIEVGVYPVAAESIEDTICENELPYHYVNGDIDTTFDVGTPNLSVFNFKLLTQHGCDSTVTLTLTINTCDTTGIPAYNDGILAVYPNPTNSTVTIQLNAVTYTMTPEIQLFDIYGRRLQVMRVSSEITEIDLSTYATGVYLVKLVSNGKVMGVRKVVRK